MQTMDTIGMDLFLCLSHGSHEIVYMLSHVGLMVKGSHISKQALSTDVGCDSAGTKATYHNQNSYLFLRQMLALPGLKGPHSS